MISRFTNIKGVGKYQDCSLGGSSFSKNTLIFGSNTEGKSTLTDILWSFKTGDKAFLEGRKTFGFNGSQIVELFDENNKLYKYPSKDWNEGFENIEIFDSHFINENIFQGSEVTYEHQKKLHSIIIGPKGKHLSEEIHRLQEELTELTAKKKQKTTDFNKAFNNEISVTEFKKLVSYPDIEKLIQETQETINRGNNQEKIKSTFESIEKLLLNITNQNFKDVLSNSIEVKASIVTDHISKNWKNTSHSLDFLQTGLGLTKEGDCNCVFCGQELDSIAKNLLDSYSKLFSEEYKNFQTEVSSVVSRFSKFNPLLILDSINDKLTSINLDLGDFKYNTEEIKDLKATVDLQFENKGKDISHKVDFSSFDELIDFFEKLNSKIVDLKNKNVLTGEVDLNNLQQKLKQFEFSKTRHTKFWDDFLKEYDNIDEIQETKRNKRERLREELNIYSDSIFTIHLDTINKVLSELNADFKICDFQPIKKLVGQSERVFALIFYNTHKVPISETALDRPRFKNTLSESDKRLLAFSFFYSLMVHDEKLDQKIIVFDDPFSSFDINRRTKTVQLLANPHLITAEGEFVEKNLNQLIILTHEIEFFKWIYQKLTTPKTLKIIPDGAINGVKKSTLVYCDIEKEFESKNKQDLRTIQEIFTANCLIEDFEGLCAKCRKILESIFTRKYLFELNDEIKSRKGPRSFVEKLNQLNINDFSNQSKYREFIFLCDNLNIELHDNTLKNDGKNAHTVLGDFLRLLREI